MATLDFYALVLTCPDKQLGPNARPAAIDCSPGAVEAPDEKSPSDPCAVSVGPTNGVPVGTYPGMTMSRLAETLSMLRLGNEIVVDETGLDGTFDLMIEEPSPTFNSRNDEARGRALQEQLGPRLLRRKGAVEILVIDRLERPTPN